MEHSYNKSGQYNLLLGKDDLSRLGTFLITDLEKYKIEIRCRTSEESITVNSFEEISKSENIPQSLYSLHIKATQYTDQEDKYIAIDSYMERSIVEIRIRGNNKTWVFGKFEEFSSFFNTLASENKKNLKQNTANSAKKRYEESGTIQACSLTKEDVIGLADVMLDSTTDPERPIDFTIRTDLSRMKIEAKNISEFLEQPELPNVLKNLTMFIHGKNNSFTYVSWDAFTSDITVRCDEEVWARGKYSQLKDYFKKRRSWYWFIQPSFSYLAGFMFLASIFALVYLAQKLQIIGIIASSISVLTWIVAFIFYYRGTLLPAVYANLKHSRPKISKEGMALLIAFVTLFLYLYELFIK